MSRSLEEKRLFALEKKQTRSYSSFVFDQNDDFSELENEFKSSFFANGDGKIFIEITLNSSSVSCPEVFVDQVQISPYKSIIAQNRCLYECFLLKGEHQIQAVYQSGENKTEAGEIEISGYVERSDKGSKLSILNFADKSILCLYLGSKNVAYLYSYQNGELTKFYEKAGVLSATLCHSHDQNSFHFAYVLDDNRAEVRGFDLTTLEVKQTTFVISTSAEKIVGGKMGEYYCIFTVERGEVYYYKMGGVAPYQKNALGLTGVAEISAFEEGDYLAVVGLDRTTTLYVLD